MFELFSPFLATAFLAWGAPVTRLEVLAFVLAIAMVVCNIRVIHWGWPLAAVSSMLYFVLFWQSRLYGEAGLQILFALVALWGWWEWLAGRRADGSALKVQTMTPRGRALAVLAAVAAWPVMGWFLSRHTDTDVPYWDAFPTAASVLGQFLLGRKFVENWPTWLVVNMVSVGLFAYKGLWLTVVLYALFAAMSLAGWRAWHVLARARA